MTDDLLNLESELDERLNEIADLKRSILELQEIYKAENTALRQRCERAEIDSENYFRLAEELRQRCEGLEEALRSIGSVENPEVDERFYALNGGLIGVIGKMVFEARAALSHPSVVDPQPQSIIDKPGSGDNDKVDS